MRKYYFFFILLLVLLPVSLPCGGQNVPDLPEGISADFLNDFMLLMENDLLWDMRDGGKYEIFYETYGNFILSDSDPDQSDAVLALTGNTEAPFTKDLTMLAGDGWFVPEDSVLYQIPDYQCFAENEEIIDPVGSESDIILHFTVRPETPEARCGVSALDDGKNRILAEIKNDGNVCLSVIVNGSLAAEECASSAGGAFTVLVREGNALIAENGSVILQQTIPAEVSNSGTWGFLTASDSDDEIECLFSGVELVTTD